MSERLANEAVIERALDALRSLAIVDGEVFLRDSRSASVEVKDSEIENVIARGERGVGVRVLDEQRVGFAYTSDLRDEGIDECVAHARRMSGITGADEDLQIASARLDDADLDIYQSIEEPPILERGQAALEVERAARKCDPRVTHFRKTSYSDGEVATYFATTRGVQASYRESFVTATTSAVATQGEERQIGYDTGAARRMADLFPERIGQTAARRAVDLLGARQIPTQRLPTVLEPRMAAALLSALAPLFSADNVLKGKSLLAGKIGRQVASEQVTIVDDARRPRGLRSAPFDGEGVATTSRTLVERGVLRGYLGSLKTARKLGVAPTGNARRGSYASPSRIGPSNFYVGAGTADPEALRRGLDRALLVTSLLNLHTIDPVSGEFSLGATGNYLERGERAYSVQGITIAGNLTDLLKAITGVGTDLEFGPSGVGSPTLVISDLSIGGA